MKTCISCKFVMFSETSDSGYRCGQVYFAQPPVQRQAMRMDSYPEVTVDHSCQSWMPSGLITDTNQG